MDVIAYTGAIWRRVVATEHRELLAATHGHLGDEGHQVVGDPLRVFTHGAAWMGADRVEVAQQGQRPVGRGTGKILDHQLDHQLALTIGIGGLQGR